MTEDKPAKLREELSNLVDAVVQHTGVSDVSIQGSAQGYHAELIVDYDPNVTGRQELIQLAQESTDRKVEKFDTPCVPLHMLIHYEQSN